MKGGEVGQDCRLVLSCFGTQKIFIHVGVTVFRVATPKVVQWGALYNANPDKAKHSVRRAKTA